MKIGFVITNYNNSHFTKEAIRSISANKLSDKTHIVIVDNNSNEKEVELLQNIRSNFNNVHLLLNSENLGYFNGLNCGIKLLNNINKNIDHVVIGNNDLLFPENFIDSIYNNKNVFEKYPVISPDIVTLDGEHQNPHVIKGISKFREIIYDIYYYNYYLAVIIKKIAKITNSISDRKDEEQYDIAQTISQGYGACYILGPIFFKYFESLWAPTFLSGEEYILSKQLESKNLRLYYEPSINVTHYLHGTLNNMPSKELWKHARESHKLCRKYGKY